MSDKVRMIRLRLSDAEWKAIKIAALNCEQSVSVFVAQAAKQMAEQARETQSRGE